VYILGERGIQEELDLIGVPWIGGESFADKKIELKSGYALCHPVYEALSYAIHPCDTRQLSVQLSSCLAAHTFEYVVGYVANLKALLACLGPLVQ